MSESSAQRNRRSEWQTVKVADAYRFTKKPRDLKLADSTRLPFIPMDLVPQGGSTKTDYIEKTIGEISSGTYFERGDILLSKITPSFENGKQGIVDKINSPYGYASTEVIPIHEIEGLSNKHFLFYYLLNPEVRHQIAERMEGSTGRQRVPESVIKEWMIPFPPFEEQRKIAAIFWKIQQAIEVETDLIRVSRELKAAVMKKLFTEGLNAEPQKETEIGKVPRSWQIQPLGDVASLERGRFLHRPRNEPRFYGGQMPFVQTGDVVKSQGQIRTFTQTLNEEGVTISRVFPKGTILITIAANIGYSGVLEFESACPDSLVAITPQQILNTWFLQFFLETQQKRMDELAPRGTQKNINIQFLQPWKVVVPALEEQKQIAATLCKLNDQIEARQRKATALNELFSNLLNDLMSASIRVTDLDIDTSCLESQGVAA